jgi:5-formyltetrahydrofolate cyclo-ligase
VLLCLPFIRRQKTEKLQFRARAIKRRKNISAEQRAQESQQASERLFTVIHGSALSKDGFVALYAATGSELSLQTLTVQLAQAGYCVAYPAISGEGAMSFYSTVGSEHLDLQTLGLLSQPFTPHAEAELSKLRKVEPHELSVVVVPGVAFGRDRYRMGFGGGYYDRFLPLLSARSRCFGVAYDEQLYRSLPTEKHDRRLDAVITPSCVIMG